MVYTEPMARAVVEPAVRELMRQCSDRGQEPSTTVRRAASNPPSRARSRLLHTREGHERAAAASAVALAGGSTGMSDIST